MWPARRRLSAGRVACAAGTAGSVSTSSSSFGKGDSNILSVAEGPAPGAGGCQADQRRALEMPARRSSGESIRDIDERGHL